MTNNKTPLPGDINSIAAEIVKNLSATPGFVHGNTTELSDMITKTLLERAGVFDDVRMGRILGSAISMI